MKSYKYTIGNTTYTTFDLSSVPESIEYIEQEYIDTSENDLLLQQENDRKKKQYEQLLETDWYITRFIETGKPIPADILELRNNIRNSI